MIGSFIYISITNLISCPSSSLDKSLREESILRVTQTYNVGNHGIEHGGCEAKWMNPNLGQQWASLDAERWNLIS